MEPLISNVSWREFFSDLSQSIPPGGDMMHPAREHMEPTQVLGVMESYLTHGECTSMTHENKTRYMQTCDGLPLFSVNHARPWAGAMSFSNILPAAHALSQAYFMDALRLCQKNGISIPDTLITGPHEAMRAQAVRIQRLMYDIHNWKLDLCIADCLNEHPFKYRWFLASRKNSQMHHRECGHGYHELCAMSWDWIVASLSVTEPVSFA